MGNTLRNIGMAGALAGATIGLGACSNGGEVLSFPRCSGSEAAINLRPSEQKYSWDNPAEVATYAAGHHIKLQDGAADIADVGDFARRGKRGSWVIYGEGDATGRGAVTVGDMECAVNEDGYGGQTSLRISDKGVQIIADIRDIAEGNEAMEASAAPIQTTVTTIVMQGLVNHVTSQSKGPVA